MWRKKKQKKHCSLSICIQGPRKYFHTFYLMVTPNQFCYKHCLEIDKNRHKYKDEISMNSVPVFKTSFLKDFSEKPYLLNLVRM